MQIGLRKSILCHEINRISRALFTPTRYYVAVRPPFFKSASFYRHCTVGAFTCIDIGRDECPALLLSFCRANMTPDLSCTRHACLCALIETRYTIKHALRRMEIFAGRCCIRLRFFSGLLPFGLHRPIYFLPRKRNKKKLTRGSVSSSCALWSDTYYLSRYLCKSTCSSIIFI